MRIRSIRRFAAAVVAAACWPAPARASWIQFELPHLSQPFGGTALAHLPDGSYVFAETGNLYLQDAWGAASYTAFDNEPSGMDPSFVAVWDGTMAAAGHGGWGASAIYTFNPSVPTSPGFTNIGVTLQNFHGVFREGLSLYTGGADTGPGGDHHGIRYLTLDGSVNRMVVDDVSVYSAGFAIDSDGNLYVGDNDDGRVYRFTKAQLDGAIGGTPLLVGDGEMIHDFGDGGNIGSLAVDADGRVWAAGWQENGIKVYNASLGQEFTYVPNLDNANYKVATFSRAGTSYAAWLNQANPFSGDTEQYYGYAPSAEYAIPEPSVLAMSLVGGLAALLLWRRKRDKV